MGMNEGEFPVFNVLAVMCQQLSSFQLLQTQTWLHSQGGGGGKGDPPCVIMPVRTPLGRNMEGKLTPQGCPWPSAEGSSFLA